MHRARVSTHTLLQYALGKYSYLTVCVLKPLTCSASCILKSVVMPYCSMHWVSTHTLLFVCVEAITMPTPCMLKSAVIPYCLCVEPLITHYYLCVKVSSHISHTPVRHDCWHGAEYVNDFNTHTVRHDYLHVLGAYPCESMTTDFDTRYN